MSEEKSRLRKEVEDIPEERRKFYRKLTDFGAVVAKLMREEEVEAFDLAEALDRKEEFVHRMLGGGINVTVETIAKLEAYFETEIITINHLDDESVEGDV
jgi:plasmid maintenance system antidote protein VapI